MKAIVTGHTRGLGEALAAELLGRGIPVLGIARGAAAQLAQRFSALLRQQALDLADAAALNAWLAGDDLRSYLAGADEILLLNNAGVVSPVGALSDQEVGEVMRAVSLNVAAPLMLSAAVVRARGAAACRILHISSGAGRGGYPGWSVYCATKAALDRHAEAAALDGEEGVRICSLAPGVIDTAMQAQIRATPEQQFPMRQRFLDLKRDGDLVAPADCARRTVDYLLGPRFGERAVDDLRG